MRKITHVKSVNIMSGLDWHKLFNTDQIENFPEALRPLSDEQRANAAVALLLKRARATVDVLFVKRVENPADPWSGQVAFPGGKRDAADLSLKHTVVRETLEETGINLLESCRFLGVLTAMHSRPRPGLKILPFVVLLEHEPSIKLNAEELEECFWIPLEKIIRGTGWVKLDVGEVPAYVVDSRVIWGLTYRILEDFLRILKLL